MKLYGICLSPFVRKVATVLDLKGLAYEVDNSMPGALPPGLSPLGKIPAFTDGEVALADSTVICEYLEDAYPQVPVLPKDPAARARARWFEEFGDSKLSELCLGGIFWERVVKKLVGGGEADEEKVQRTITELLPPQLDYLEGQLPAEGFLCGDFGIADIGVASPLLNAGYAGFSPDPARWPKLVAFLQRVSAQPAVRKQLDAEAALMKQMAG